VILDQHQRARAELDLDTAGSVGEEQDANAAPLGTVERSDARREAEKPFDGYYMEEVRRELIAKYGADIGDGGNSVYSGGLWVRTSLDPVTQKAAEQALRDGLVRFEAAAGWRGRSGHIDVDASWPAKLSAAKIETGYANWRDAVILEKDAASATLGFEDGSKSQLFPWGAAAPKRGIGGRAFDFLKPGDIVIVAPAGSGWALRSTPQIVVAAVNGAAYGGGLGIASAELQSSRSRRTLSGTSFSRSWS